MREIFRGRGGRSRWRVAAAVVATGIALPMVVAGVDATPAMATSFTYGTGSGFCHQVDPPTGNYLGATLDNVWACGPEGGDFSVAPFETSDFGFQCTELANRFLWDAHQLAPINDSDAPGDNLVGGNFALSVHDQHTSIPLVSSGTKTLPSAGDIISMWKGTGAYGQDGDDSHVAVVTGVVATSSGWNITVMEENAPDTDHGYNTITVSANGADWSYGPKYFTSFDWVHFAPLTIPAEPESLSASSVTGSSAVLHWTDSANNVGQYLTQYKIGNGNWTPGPSAPAGATSVSVGGLRTGATYTFQVGASNAKGTRWSAYLTVKTVPIPAEPAIGNPAMAARDATISWNEAASNETEFLTQYKLGSGAWQAGPSVGSGTRSVTVGGLIPGESYTFQVGANNIAGTRWSAYATGSTPQVLASQVTNARVTATSETAAALAWTNTADNVASFVTQYRVSGTSAWTAGPSVGAGTTSVTVGGLEAGTKYTFQVGAKNSRGTNWGQYFYGTTASAPAPAPAPTGYNTGREVTVVSQATGGDSGRKGPANSYAGGPTHAAGSPIYIVCYVNGQSIAGPYGTETAWDLGDDGYYYSDAWLWTDSNGPVVPACDLKTVTVVSQATGGDSGRTGPSNAYSAGPARAAGSGVQIACYVSGQSIAGPYGTESVWDLSTDGYYYSDAWLWTDSNGPVVPECP